MTNPTEPSEEWFYERGGQQQGPVQLAVIRQMLAQGQLGAVNMVWRQGMANWIPAGQAFATPGAGPVLGYYVPPQTIQFAGFWIRLLAFIVDGIVTGVAAMIAGAIAGAMIGGIMGASGGSRQQIHAAVTPIVQIMSWVIGWLYEALMLSSVKQATIGKMLCGIRVTDDAGQRISFGRATGRHFAKWISAAILLIGYIMAAFTERKRALHDMIAGTVVIKNPKI